MSRADVRAGRAFVELNIRDSAFNKALNNASKRLTTFGTDIMKIGGVIAGSGAAIIAPIAGAVREFLSAGDALDKMRQRTGISVEALSELSHAATQSGTSLEAVEKAVRRMQKEVGTAGVVSKQLTDSLDSMGVSLESLRRMNPEQQFTTITDGIAAIEDPTQRASAAMAVFGKSGTELLPMIEDLATLRKEARDLGLVMSGEAAADAVKLGDMLANLWKTIKFMGHSLAATLAKPLMEVVAGLQKSATAVLKWTKDNSQVVIVVAKVGAALIAAGAIIASFGAAFVGLGVTLKIISLSMMGFVNALLAVKAVVAAVAAGIAVLFSPLGILVALTAGAVAAWLAFTKSGNSVVKFFTSRFGQVYDVVKDTIGGVVDAIKGGDLSKAATIAMRGVTRVVRVGIASLGDIWEGIKSTAKAAWDTVTAIVSGAVSALGSTVKNALGSTWEAVAGSVRGVVDRIKRVAADIAAPFVDAFARIRDVVGESIGGIADALMAGEFALAGKIAITGLRLAIAEGMDAIGANMTGIFGAAVSKIASLIAGGDFLGAWNVAVQSMSAVWDAWAEGITKTFTGVARSVVDAWQVATSFISRMIIEHQGKLRKLLDAMDILNPVAILSGVSTADRILGPDIQKEQKRSDTTQKQLDDVNRRNLTSTREEVVKNIEMSEVSGDTEALEAYRQQLAMIDEQLANIGTTSQDVIGDAINDAARNLASTADTVRDAIDEIDRTAEARTQAGFDAVTAATEVNDLGLQKLRDELAALRASAKESREKADAEPVEDKRPAVEGEPPEAKAAPVAVTSSAAGLLALGAGSSGVQERTLEEIRQMRKDSHEANKLRLQAATYLRNLERKLDFLGMEAT